MFPAAGGLPLAENLHVRFPARCRRCGHEQTFPGRCRPPRMCRAPCALPLSRLNGATPIRLAASRLPTSVRPGNGPGNPTCIPFEGERANDRTRTQAAQGWGDQAGCYTRGSGTRAICSAVEPRHPRGRIECRRTSKPVAVWRRWLELRMIACEGRRNLLAESSRNVLAVVCRVPEGAFHFREYFDHPAITSSQICNFLLEEARVASVPGEAYGLGGGHRVQFSLATSEDLLQEAAERIGVAMKHAMEGKSARPAIP